MISENVQNAVTPGMRSEEPASGEKGLRERLQEFTCLYESRRQMGPELPLEDICGQVFNHLIPAMHFPAIASAVIELDGRRFRSENYREGSAHALQSNISVRDRLCGHLRVFYPDNTSFLLPEEQELIDAIACDLEIWLKQINCLYEIRRSAELELPLEDVCQQVFEHLIPALQFPEATTVMIELDDRRFAAGSHEQGLTHELHSKISADNKLRGRLRVFYPLDKPFLVPEEQRLVDAVGIELGKWLEAKKIDETLLESLKEVTCLYEIRRNLGLELSLDNVCQHIFTHLIPAMQFPEIATAVIELDGRRFTSDNHAQGLTHELRSNITVNKTPRGHLRVFYPEDKPFLIPEEQRLVGAVAGDLERWLEGKRLEDTLVSVAEKYQRMIGQELHDNLGQQIAAIGYQAEALEQDISAYGIPEAAKVAASIATQAQDAVKRCKELAQGLLPFELETYGLIIALQALANRVADAYKISCEFIHKNDVAINDNKIALNLYRIAQEAISNAVRHGGAHHIIISLSSDSEILYLSISDDGNGISGIDTEHGSAAGVGIKIMHHRARQLGGKLKFLSRPQEGTEVRLEMRMVPGS